MTTLEHHHDSAEIFRRLSAVATHSRLIGLLAGGLAAVAIISAAVLVCAAGMAYWVGQPPAAIRWVLLVGLIALSVFVVGWFVVRTALLRRNPAQTARLVEQALPQLRNDLINSVLLAGDSQQASPELVDQAIAETIRQCDGMDLAKSISTLSLRRWATAAAISAAMLLAFASLQYQPFKRGLLAVLMPSDYVSTVNTIELLSIEPNDSTPPRFAGSPLNIVAKIRNADAKPYKAEVLIDGEASPRAMLATEGASVFACPMGNVDQTFRFAVRIGNNRWPADKEFFTVTVIQKVDVKSLAVAFDYPAYTGLKNSTKEIAGPFEAPMGTKAALTLRLSAAVPTVTLEQAGGSPIVMTPSPDRLSHTAALPVDKDGDYRLLLMDAAGKVMQQLPDTAADNHADANGQAGKSTAKGYYHIHAVPDNPPEVKFIAPGRDISAGAGEKVAMRIRAFDEYALSSVKLYAGLPGGEAKPVENFPPAKLAKNEMIFDYAFDLAGYKKGDVVEYYFTATDNRNLPIGGPQTSASPRYKITVADAAALAATQARNFEALPNRLPA
ncbi:MAG: hypothetical protein EHM48_07015, partial [Planctomycetaceae bacterium]